MKEIIINNKATIKATGIRTSGNCKPVICIDTGKVYASCYDAAEAVGVHFTSMSMVCRGKTKSCKGKRYCYIENVNEHLEEMTSNIAKLSAMEEKARMWDEYQAEQERIHKAEEERIRAEQERLAAIERAKAEREERKRKLEAKVERQQRIIERIEAELQRAKQRHCKTLNEWSALCAEDDEEEVSVA